jgi:hypothetical protein
MVTKFFGILGVFFSENSKKLLKNSERNHKTFKTAKLKKKKKKKERPDYNI